ncbi:hypothetical protein [Dietzia sp. 179-F 9C3 NHS]|uniref:hypothetical protein n=1 Tax=Dietzia sp. 179-F 9C3 NHS TaxID=3374295 RepID=UPI00387A0D53
MTNGDGDRTDRPDQHHGYHGDRGYGGYGEQSYGEQPYGGSSYGAQPHGEPYGYGSYGASYPNPGYGEPMPPGQLSQRGRISAPEVVGAAWRLFTGNPLPWILIVLISLLASGATSFLGQPIEFDPETLETTTNQLGIVSTLISFVVGLLVQAVTIRGALLEVDGHKPSIGDFFKLHNFGWFVVAAILVGIAVFVGLFALLIGALVVSFFLYWTDLFVIDRNMTATDAMKSSFNAIKSDGGNLLALAALNVLIVIAGALALFVGLFVAIPVATLASTYAYRVITGPSDFSRRATTDPATMPQQGY